MNQPKIIAEIGCNHKGSMDIAKELIVTAATYCKADCVKFKKDVIRNFLRRRNITHPIRIQRIPMEKHMESIVNFLDPLLNSTDSFNRGALNSNRIFHICVGFDICKGNYDIAAEIDKIPSAINLNKPVLQYLCDNFSGDIHLSFGMTTKEEEEEIVQFFEDNHRAQNLVIYSCTSGYPVPFEDICLLELSRMKEAYGKRVKAIGFSGHHLGIAVDSAAVSLGAEYIERHYTLDRTWKGTDHAASLEPDGVRKLVRDCRAVYKALTYKKEDVLDIEKVQRNKLKKNSIKWS